MNGAIDNHEVLLHQRGAALRRGFTLVELLVVMAIIAMMGGLVIAGVQQARESGRRAQCAAKLRQIGIATNSYVAAKESFPPGVEQWYFNSAVSHRGIPLFAYLLPHLELDHLLYKWDTKDPMNNVTQGGERSNAAQVVSIFLCPTDPIPQTVVQMQGRDWWFALSSYGGNGGTRAYFPAQSTADGMFHTTGEASEPKHYQRPVEPRDVKDGLTSTILFGERSHDDENYQSFNNAGWGEPLAQWGYWGACVSRKMVGHVSLCALTPINYRLPFSYEERQGQSPPAGSFSEFQTYVDMRICAFGSSHRGGANFCMADGSVNFKDTETDLTVFRALCTRAGYDK